MDDNTNKAMGNDNGNNNQEPEKTVEYVSTGFAVKSVWHNAKEGTKKVVAKAKPVGKKVVKGLLIVGGIALGAKALSELKDGKEEPKLDEPDEVEAIDTVVQFNDDGDVIVTPELGSETDETTTE